MTTALEAFRFDEAAHHLYHFLWGTFCDWYLEFTKPILQTDDEGARAETRATTAWVLAQTVHLLHPVMPFISEEVWQQLAGTDAGMLIVAPWPDLAPDLARPGRGGRDGSVDPVSFRNPRRAIRTRTYRRGRASPSKSGMRTRQQRRGLKNTPKIFGALPASIRLWGP